ncbi:MAG: catalase [Agathobacter sp.]|nr:catalase [Agathobacter sp.]
MKALDHLKTINHHKMLVMKGCFQLGMYKQGLLHDLSKYLPSEFLVGCKYYRGYMSPNNVEREERGYSSAWLHHKGRNKHHLEYWIDYTAGETAGEEHQGMSGMKMPVKYVVEMFVDRVSASKNYQGENYTDESPVIYYNKGKGHYLIHPDTAALLEFLLEMLAKRGEEATFSYIRRKVLTEKIPYDKTTLDRWKERL